MDLPVDLSFTKALPKVEVSRSIFSILYEVDGSARVLKLHAHLSGSISRECLHDLWIEACREQPDLTIEDPATVLPYGKVDFDVMAFFPLFNTYIYAFVNSIPAVIISTDSVLNDFAADGVIYLELRTTPRSCPGFTKEQYVTTILNCISAHNVQQAEMRTRLIVSIDRKHAAAEVAEIIDMAIRYRSRGVVGVDLCGDPSRPINLIMLQREFARAKAAGLGVTLHFAEIAASSSLVELEGLLAMRPDRLGHVIHVDGEVKEEIAARKTGLELCLSCNVNAKLTSGGIGGHHFRDWWSRKERGAIGLCTDDVGIFLSPLSLEHCVAAQHFGLSREDLVYLCERTIEMIFGGQDDATWIQERVVAFRKNIPSNPSQA